MYGFGGRYIIGTRSPIGCSEIQAADSDVCILLAGHIPQVFNWANGVCFICCLIGMVNEGKVTPKVAPPGGLTPKAGAPESITFIVSSTLHYSSLLLFPHI